MTRAELCEEALARKDELIQLVSDIIQIPSENPTGSQRQVVDFVKRYLEDSGIPCEEVGVNPDFPCVLAKMGSEDGFSVILNGHIDVVPAGDLEQWDYDPFCGTVTDKRILGRGTSDMKSGVAGLLFAMRILKESGVELKGNIRLHIVSDEESGGEYGSKWLCENGYADGANACLIAEPTSCDNIEIGQKGGLHVILKAHGESAHGSLAGFKGDNAILKLSRILDKLSRLTSIEGHYKPSQMHALAVSKRQAEEKTGVPGSGEVISHVSANVGVIHGGTRPNMVPDYCEATVDVRLPIGVDHQEIEDMLCQIIEESGETGIEREMHWNSEGNYTEETETIVECVRKNAEAIWGIKVEPGYQWASSDAREYRKLGIPTIQYGPANTEGIHSYNENVDIEDVVNCGQIYVLSLCDMLGIE
ncbi:MAG: ArgE/DapE family deacylase [Lachnospiraceae bacterium]|nr:ArgE/DapE family deacylase [Lachnospiraceae bacterium]